MKHNIEFIYSFFILKSNYQENKHNNKKAEYKIILNNNKMADLKNI